MSKSCTRSGRVSREAWRSSTSSPPLMTSNPLWTVMPTSASRLWFASPWVSARIAPEDLGAERHPAQDLRHPRAPGAKDATSLVSRSGGTPGGSRKASHGVTGDYDPEAGKAREDLRGIVDEPASALLVPRRMRVFARRIEGRRSGPVERNHALKPLPLEAPVGLAEWGAEQVLGARSWSSA